MGGQCLRCELHVKINAAVACLNPPNLLPREVKLRGSGTKRLIYVDIELALAWFLYECARAVLLSLRVVGALAREPLLQPGLELHDWPAVYCRVFAVVDHPAVRHM